ncbi:hypothetical protein SLEP1_g56421 [Rubroshorea leprosula]|uniref:DUF4283 domain-containing protein n=1 Tax=Rubroshorea leprosula TaxID=152421 RepID=A0AAV5MLD7_9ROSI|nr:hypothetical protein SLEP1_g56421 [Rubroshorea leprosula]
MGGKGRKKKDAPPRGGPSKEVTGTKSVENDAKNSPIEDAVKEQVEVVKLIARDLELMGLVVEEVGELQSNPRDTGLDEATAIESRKEAVVWENALVGYVLGCKPHFKDMANYANKRWKEFQVPKVFSLRNGVFLFDFADGEAKQAVLEKRWTFQDHPLILKQWTLDFDPNNQDVSKIPVWIQFPDLHLSLWNPESLGKMANYLGVPIATDALTAKRNCKAKIKKMWVVKGSVEQKQLIKPSMQQVDATMVQVEPNILSEVVFQQCKQDEALESTVVVDKEMPIMESDHVKGTVVDDGNVTALFPEVFSRQAGEEAVGGQILAKEDGMQAAGGGDFNTMLKQEERCKKGQIVPSDTFELQNFADKCEEVKEATREYERVVETDLMLATQKAKVDWLREVDTNSSYFHAIVQKKQHIGNIASLTTEAGKRITQRDDIGQEFVNFFQNLFGTSVEGVPSIDSAIVKRGRIQLVNSVLFHIQVFWSGVLLLPKKVIKSIDAAFRNFVWTRKWDQSAMALVAWSDICVPKTEGGLGVKQLASWDRAALCKYIWLICKNQQDLWVQWAQVVLLKGESIWKVKLPNDCSWSWKQILKMRTSIKDQVWVQIGDGRQTSLFYDLWLEGGRLCDRVQVREELMAWGHGSVVAKWWDAGAWHMPDSFVRKYPSLAQLISSKNLQDKEDKVVWRPTISGCFSIASCYNLLRVK